MTFVAKVTSSAALGLALQQARLANGLSQRELAERIGTSQRYIWELESGKNAVLLERILAALAETGATMSIEIPEDGNG